MVLEKQPLPYLLWLATALPWWLLTIGFAGLTALVVCFIVTAARHGPGRAGEIIVQTLIAAAKDVLLLSPRRAWAIARLSVQEALRRWVLIVPVIYLAILAISLWFLDSGRLDPAKLYLSFVHNFSTALILVAALFLSTLSIPSDIKNHTIYTVVTKPVRPSEIVLGRVVGFSLVGTGLLAVMAAASYFFVVRALDHSHTIEIDELVSIENPGSGKDAFVQTGRTTTDRGHHHQVSIRADGTGTTDIAQGHRHEITRTEVGGRTRYDLGPALGQFHARMPVYGKLTFLDREGKVKSEGINVGNEWTYRSYIEGASQAAAIWRFENLRKQDFPDGLPLELTIRVFRTHKGNIEKGVLGSFVLRNPRNRQIASQPRNFYSKEFTTDAHLVPRKLVDANNREIDLFDDLVDDGQLDLELTCVEGGQYFGMAQPDVYLLPRESSFEWNFVKSYLGIWLLMVLVTTFGVAWSTFLNAPVAIMATLATMVFGFVRDRELVQELVRGEAVGGGPFESLYKILTQKSISIDLEPGLATNVIHAADWIAERFLQIITLLVPNMAGLQDSRYLADGFNIPLNLLLAQLTTTLAYVVPVLLCGFLCLKLREVAK